MLGDFPQNSGFRVDAGIRALRPISIVVECTFIFMKCFKIISADVILNFSSKAFNINSWKLADSYVIFPESNEKHTNETGCYFFIYQLLSRVVFRSVLCQRFVLERIGKRFHASTQQPNEQL